jgi:hypothetical protein
LPTPSGNDWKHESKKLCNSSCSPTFHLAWHSGTNKIEGCRDPSQLESGSPVSRAALQCTRLVLQSCRLLDVLTSVKRRRWFGRCDKDPLPSPAWEVFVAENSRLKENQAAPSNNRRRDQAAQVAKSLTLTSSLPAGNRDSRVGLTSIFGSPADGLHHEPLDAPLRRHATAETGQSQCLLPRDCNTRIQLPCILTQAGPPLRFGDSTTHGFPPTSRSWSGDSYQRASAYQQSNMEHQRRTGWPREPGKPSRADTHRRARSYY